MAQANSPGEALFELGKLYCDRGDFDVSIEKLEQAADSFYKEKSFDRYLKCQNMLLRMYSEREDNEKINLTKERLQDLVLKEGFELSAKTYYTLGVSASFKQQFDLALEYFQKSLAIALAADEKEDMCYAINGFAHVYFRTNRLSDALKEIYNLQVFFQVLALPDLKLSTQIVNGLILRNMERYDQALDIFWECHETLKDAKNMYMYFHLLYAIGTTYQRSGDNDLARVYLQLAKRSIDSRNLKQLSVQIDARLEELGVRPNDDYDLIFDPASNSVVERKKGRIDFKNQFILLDLLHLFLKNPGAIYSKEVLVKKVWGQDYNPAVHDNKIYVTIKRLRQLIEPDYEKPKYIFRSKNGYYLNKGTKVLLEQ